MFGLDENQNEESKKPLINLTRGLSIIAIVIFIIMVACIITSLKNL